MTDSEMFRYHVHAHRWDYTYDERLYLCEVQFGFVDGVFRTWLRDYDWNDRASILVRWDQFRSKNVVDLTDFDALDRLFDRFLRSFRWQDEVRSPRTPRENPNRIVPEPIRYVDNRKWCELCRCNDFCWTLKW